MNGPIIHPPQRFDENEWFLLIITVAIWFVVLLLPKRFSVVTFVLIWLVNVSLAQIADFVIGKKPLQLYDYNDSEKFEWFDIWLYMITYPPAAYLFLYVYDRFKAFFQSRLWKSAAYVIAAVLATVGIEALSVHYRVFKYFHWNLYLSALVYIGVFCINLLIYHLVCRSLGRNSLLVRRRKR